MSETSPGFDYSKMNLGKRRQDVAISKDMTDEQIVLQAKRDAFENSQHGKAVRKAIDQGERSGSPTMDQKIHDEFVGSIHQDAIKENIDDAEVKRSTAEYRKTRDATK